jgi:HipA-like protein
MNSPAKRVEATVDVVPFYGQIEIGDRATRFTYDGAWLKRPDAVPVSLTLPLRAEPFDASGLHPFFESVAGGWLLQLSRAEDPPDDAFLLLATCATASGRWRCRGRAWGGVAGLAATRDLTRHERVPHLPP